MLGLEAWRKVKVLDERTPDCVFKKVIVLLNAFHQGSGENHLDFLAEALGIEHAWRAECRVTQLNTYNPRYAAAYDSFIMSKATSPEFNGFFKAKNPYYTALALAHHLQNYNVYERVIQWSHAFVDFLDARYDPQSTINAMHALTSLIVTSQKKYCPKAKIGIIIFEAVKACVPVLSGTCGSSVVCCVGCSTCVCRRYGPHHLRMCIHWISLAALMCCRTWSHEPSVKLSAMRHSLFHTCSC